MRGKILVWLLTGVSSAGICLSAIASPTLMGLHAKNPTNANIYGDTFNASLLYVAPPTIGDLKVIKQSFTVDTPTCQAVASVNKTRLSESNTIEVLASQILNLEELRGGLITKLINKEIGQSEFDKQYMLFADLIEKTTQDKLKAVASMTPTPAALLERAGYYAVVAKVQWDDAVSKVAAANPTLTVNHIPTADAQVFVSVLGVDGFAPNDSSARECGKHQGRLVCCRRTSDRC
jgi:hypothetical protein